MLGLDLFLPLIRFDVGSGERIRFWEDVWVGEASLGSSFLNHFRFSSKVNVSFNSIVLWKSSRNYSWSISFRRNLNDNQLMEFLLLSAIIDYFPLSNSSED